MSASVPQDLPIAIPDGHIAIPVSEEQDLAIRKAAELVGWTVEQYVLSAVLDRAERDLHEHATARRGATGGTKGQPPPETTATNPATATVEPYIAIVTAALH